MSRNNGGIIGPDNDPTSSVATGVWTLKQQRRAVLGSDWPLVGIPITITSLGTTVTQSNRDVTGINLSSVNTSDFLIVVYGSEGAGTVTSATLAGTSLSVDETSVGPTEFPSLAIMSVTADANIAGAASATLDITSSGTGTQFRAACAVFVLSRSASAFATHASDNQGTSFSTTINFSSGALFTAYYDANEGAPTLTGVANVIDEDMGSASSDFFIGYSDSTNSGSATHSIGYTSGASSGNAFAAVVYT